MRKLPSVVALAVCSFLCGCQTPLFSDGLFGAFTPKKTLTATNESQTPSATNSKLSGRGWRNASSRVAEAEFRAAGTGENNANRLRDLLAQGNDAMQKGMYDDARIHYESILNLEPGHANAHHMLGRISDMTKKFEEAEKHYLAALGANRNDGYLVSDLGYSYLQQGRLDDARKYLWQAITLEPTLAIAKVNMAAVHAYSGDEAGALAWLRQVGTEQQAQETLTAMTSRPAPYLYNQASGALAKNSEKYTISPEGDVLDANGKPIQSWDEIRRIMKSVGDQQRRDREMKERATEQLADEQMRRAIAQESRNTGDLNDPARLNQQMRDIDLAAASERPVRRNNGPITVGPPNRGSVPLQFPPQNGGGSASGQNWTPQEQYQQNSQFDPPNQYVEQPWQNQQPSGQYSESQQGPGNSQGANQTIDQQQYLNQQQYLQQQYLNSQQYQQQRNAPQTGLNTGSTDQYGNPYQNRLPTSPLQNGPPGAYSPEYRSTAPIPGFYGQGPLPGNLPPQAGPHSGYQQTGSPEFRADPSGQPGQYSNGTSYYGQGPTGSYNPNQAPNSRGNTQQPIQQLGFDNNQRPLARIDRGQRLPQYTDADRQAMQLGMSAGQGALSLIDSGQQQPTQSGQSMQSNGPQSYGPQTGDQQAYGPPPNPDGTSANYGNWSQQPQQGQQFQNGQQQSDREYPGAVHPTSEHLPGQADIWAPGTPAHGRPASDFATANPQTAQPWLNMPGSQADVTIPDSWNFATQQQEQRSRNYSQPDQLNPSWQNEALSSPTTKAAFSQPFMTNPQMRQTNTAAGQQPNPQSIQSTQWITQQPVGSGQN